MILFCVHQCESWIDRDIVKQDDNLVPGASGLKQKYFQTLFMFHFHDFATQLLFREIDVFEFKK